jgi:site-specific recombinase XerD
MARMGSIYSPVRTSDAAVSGFVERSVSPATRETYRRTVREFQRFLGRSVVDAGPDDVRRWRDDLAKRGQRPATIARKLSTVRSLYAYLEAGGYVVRNPASAKLVPPPELRSDRSGRALAPQEVRHLLCGPDRASTEGARDYAILLSLARLGLRVSELCALRASSLWRSKSTWALTVKVKGGAERELPVPDDVREAIAHYLRLDAKRRQRARSGGADAFVFQPLVNYRTLQFDRPLTRRHVQNIVARWAAYCGIGRLSPHDLRRTAITRALELGLSYYEVQLMSGHRDPKTVQRYDHRRSALEQSAINRLHYDE